MMLLMEQKGAQVTYSDPYVPTLLLCDRELKSSDALAMATQADCVLIATDHTAVDYVAVLERARLIVDARNVFKNQPSPKIVRL